MDASIYTDSLFDCHLLSTCVCCLIVADYPPMREFAGEHEEFGILCPYNELWDMEVELFSAINNLNLPRLSARLSPENIVDCVRRVLAMSVSQMKQLAQRGRQRFLQELLHFRAVLQDLKQEAELLMQLHKVGQSK